MLNEHTLYQIYYLTIHDHNLPFKQIPDVKLEKQKLIANVRKLIQSY